MRDLKDLTASTSDAAFAIDSNGLIVAWNSAAEDLFGVASSEAVGRQCGDLVRGSDECGPVCSPNCAILQAMRRRRRICNFDLQVETPQGKRWCNYSVLVASVANCGLPFALHIIRPIDLRKRMEMLVRDFILTGTGVGAERAKNLIAMTLAPARVIELSRREKEILALLAKGLNTRQIAAQLHISTTTINNHVQHIFRKLNAHTRLEAVRRAGHAGLI